MPFSAFHGRKRRLTGIDVQSWGNRMREVRALVSGRVQGVGYRYFARDQATRLELSGWVRNNPDGTVSVSAVGEEGLLQEFLNALMAPDDPFIRVTGITVEWHETEKPGNEFEIRR
jgi:acylphosphatase